MSQSIKTTTVSAPGLSIVRNLLENLHREEVRYCHWKSNEHVDAAVQGETDLDILFDPDQKDRIISILKHTGFRLFVAPWWKRYPGIEDYIGIDPETGKIVHVHTHFALVLGEKGVKSYHLSWADDILSSRIFNEPFKIYCSAPATELLLLIVRMALKVEDGKRWSVKNKGEIENYIRESEWLKSRVSVDELLGVAQEKLEYEAFVLIESIYQGKYETADFKKLQEVLRRDLKGHRRFGTIEAVWIKYIRRLAYYSSKALVKFKLKEFTQQRHLVPEGIIVSIMGADGAGKSTQTKRIYEELNKKIDVRYIYMGSGDGSASTQRKWIRGLLQLGRKLLGYRQIKNHRYGEDVERRNSVAKDSLLKRIANVITALSIAKEKKVKLRKARKARLKGAVVICDRYPQTTILGYNDGPKLTQYLENKWFIFRKLAQYEYSVYAKSSLVHPDLVIKLLGTPDTLFERRPDMSLERLQAKQNGIKEILFSQNTEIFEVDAAMELNQVTIQLMKIIGGKLNSI